MPPSHDTMLSLKLELLHDMLEITLHRSNNRMTVGSSHVDLLSMVPDKIRDPEHLEALSRVFQESAELHSRLVKLSRRTITPPVSDVLLSEFLTSSNPMLELAARSRHKALEIQVAAEASETLLPGEASVWLEMALLKLCRTPQERGQYTMRINFELAPPSALPHTLIDTRKLTSSAPSSHLHIHVTPGATLEDPSWRTSLEVMLSHLLELRPGALWLDDDGLRLELALSRRISLPELSPPQSHKPGSLPQLTPMRCLLIDDEPAMLGPLKRILKYQGYEVSTFSSPLAALDHIEATGQTYDIALVDYAMNELNGIQTLRRLRVHQPDLRAIIITGMPDDNLLATLERDPLSSKLSKPWNMTTLLELLSVHLDDTDTDP